MTDFFHRDKPKPPADDGVLPSGRGQALLYLVIGGALVVAAVLLIKYLGVPELKKVSYMEQQTRDYRIARTNAAIPGATLLFGVLITYVGLTKLVLGSAMKKIGVKQINGATIAFALGALAMIGLVLYIVIGVWNLRL